MHPTTQLLSEAESARIELEKLLVIPRGTNWIETDNASRKLTPCDVVITPNEVTPCHGTGVLVHRLFGNSPHIISIRSRNLHQDHQFGERSFCLDHTNLSRAQIYRRLLDALEGYEVRRIVCVPFYADDLLSAIALRDIFNAPLCTYIMDDQSIYDAGISDVLIREALTKSTLRLAISPEMRNAYENNYRCKFWLLPPLVDEALVSSTLKTDERVKRNPRTGILIGNVWSKQWLDWTRETVRNSGCTIDWYGNASASWLNVTKEELAADGIHDCGFVPERELHAVCKKYAYALVPSGTLEEKDHTGAIARLSLPTRLPFLLSSTHTPILVLGSKNTAAARFVERFECGLVCDYLQSDFIDAVARISHPEAQQQMRQNAASKATGFSSEGATAWLWSSLAKSEPHDLRFEKLMPRSESDVVFYVDEQTPPDIWVDFAMSYHVMRRLSKAGYQPDFILDIGASSGVWSHAVKKAFPKSRFILVDPLLEKYAKLSGHFFQNQNPEFTWIKAAVSDESGELIFQVSDDLYGSSLLLPNDSRKYQDIKVPAFTLDELAQQQKLVGRGILKIDVQCAEHKVLAGASALMPQIDVLILEVSMVRFAKEALVFEEMLELAEKLGFYYYDELGCWRSPVDGTLLQKDILFLRKEMPLRRII